MIEDAQTVLVVDDTPQNIDILSNVLRSDYKVKAALNGQKAIEIACKQPHPDIILLDIMMPDMDGFEVCKQLKANPATESIPIVFITAMTDAEDETLGLKLGAVDYISKPINPAIVLSRVRTHLQIAAQTSVLDTVVSNMAQGMCMFDKKLRLVTCNDLFLSMFNYPATLAEAGTTLDQFLRMSVERGDYGDGNIEDIIKACHDRLLSFETYEFKLGKEYQRIIQVDSSPLETGGFVSTFSDITELVTNQETARRLREAMEVFSDAIVLYDKDEKVVFTNDKYHEFYPNSPSKDKVVGHTLEQLIRCGLNASVMDDELAKSDPEKWLEERLRDRRASRSGERNLTDGRTLLYRHRPTTDGGMIVALTDITSRKAAEREIAQKEAELRMALENMPGGMIVVDKDLKVTLLNEMYRDFYGDPDGITCVGNSMQDILASEVSRNVLNGEGSPDDILQERLKSYAISKPVIFEDKTQDGRHIQLTRRPAPDGHTVSVAVDITERKNAEDLLAKSVGLINESIQYASYIQRSVLPTETEMEDVFADYFSVWEPKDVVGGDIYLIRKYEAGVMLFVADCTGHGVPGAFMTMIATGALDQAIIENPKADPGLLLQRTNQLVKSTLGQYEDSDGQSDDGLECGLCLIDQNTGDLSYAGARFELWRVVRGELDVTKGERHGIGYRKTPYDNTFANHTVTYDPEAMLYLFSDGLIDQIGGAKRLGYGKRRLKSNLLDYYPMTLRKQSAHLMRDFEEYQHTEVRRDDVTLIGFAPRVK